MTQQPRRVRSSTLVQPPHSRTAIFLVTLAILVAVTVVVLMVPVAPHDWGDDFAMYIAQAAGLTGDRRFDGLFVPHRADSSLWYSPSSYPPGFPLLLAPVYAIWGVNLPAMQAYMSLLLVLTGYAAYRYAYAVLRQRPIAIALGLLVVLHSVSLDLKQLILSDIPFTLAVLLFLDSVEGRSRRFAPLLLAVTAWLIRTAGAVLVLTWLADAVFGLIARRTPRDSDRRNLATALACAVVMRLVSLAVTDTQGYQANFGEWLSIATPRANLALYGGMFEYYLGALFGFSLAVPIGIGLALLCGVGAYLVFREGRRVCLWFLAGYLALLLIYPYQMGGFRMILPLVPVLWILAAHGGLALARRLSASAIPPHVAAAVLVALACRQVAVFSARDIPASITPESAESRELFAQIRAQVPEDALTLSAKPRALALFTGRRGMSIQAAAAQPEVEQLIRDSHVGFVICGTPLRHAALDTYCRDRSSPPIFRNAAFAIYRTGS